MERNFLTVGKQFLNASEKSVNNFSHILKNDEFWQKFRKLLLQDLQKTPIDEQ